MFHSQGIAARLRIAALSASFLTGCGDGSAESESPKPSTEAPFVAKVEPVMLTDKPTISPNMRIIVDDWWFDELARAGNSALFFVDKDIASTDSVDREVVRALQLSLLDYLDLDALQLPHDSKRGPKTDSAMAQACEKFHLPQSNTITVELCRHLRQAGLAKYILSGLPSSLDPAAVKYDICLGYVAAMRGPYPTSTLDRENKNQCLLLASSLKALGYPVRLDASYEEMKPLVKDAQIKIGVGDDGVVGDETARGFLRALMEVREKGSWTQQKS